MSLAQVLFAVGALAWILHRAAQLINKPLSELIEVLGLDIPSAPIVSAAAITSDSVQLHWLGPENGVSKYQIEINGDITGSTSKGSTIILIRDLQPDTLYTIRILATNSSAFQSSSNTLRFRTASSTLQNFSTSDTFSNDPQSLPVTLGRESSEEAAFPSPLSPKIEPVISTLASFSRDQSTSNSIAKRPLSTRRSLPGFENETTASDLVPANDTEASKDFKEGSVDGLNRQLDSIQKETEDTSALAIREEEDFLLGREQLFSQSEHLRQLIQDRESGSAELRKDLHNLERTSKAVQKKKREKEQQLHQKQGEREKMRQDISRWEKDIVDSKRKFRRIDKDRRKMSEETEKKIAQSRKQMSEDQEAIVRLEDQIKSKGIQIRDLEGERRRLGASSLDGDQLDVERLEREKEAQWHARQAELRKRYAIVTAAHDQAEASYKQAQAQLAYFQAQYSILNLQGLPAAETDTSGAKKGKHRRNRQRKSRSNTGSSTENKSAASSIFGGKPSSTSAPFSSSSPYFNMSNGMTMTSGPEQTTGNAKDSVAVTPMSPSANGYLPSDLLGDDEVSSFGGLVQANSLRTTHDLVILPPLKTDASFPDPHSPHSSGSLPASAFSSPRNSMNNLPTYRNVPESYLESDRKSLNSNHASLSAIDETADTNLSGTRKLTDILFPFNLRQRDKGATDDGLAFGSLKTGQSQSFPRNLQSVSEKQDPIGTRARSGSQTHSSGWRGQFGSLLNRNTLNGSEASEGNAPALARALSSRRNRYDPFRSDSDPLEPSAFFQMGIGSPRPGSTSSRGEGLPRPSTDSQARFGWPTDGHQLKGPIYGIDWSANSDPWSSRAASRRQSLRQGSASSSSLGQSSLGQTTADIDVVPHAGSSPAPIGTKPKSFAQRAKLNPNAPAFSLNPFNRSDSKKVDKSEIAERKREKKEKIKAQKDRKREEKKDEERDRDLIPFPPVIEDSIFSSRRSRDSRSINTETSQSESHDSLERSVSGSTPSECPTPGGGSNAANANNTAAAAGAALNKESLIQKLTRKGSSGKFNIGWKEKTSLFGKKSVEIESGGFVVEEGTEGSGESIIGRSADSATSSPNIGADGRGRKGWGMLGRKRRGEKAASEASEKASETETGDEDD